VRTIRRPRTTSELVIRQPAHDAGTSKKAIMGTQPELQPPSSISKAYEFLWDVEPFSELDDFVSTTSPTALPKPVPAVSLEHRSSTKITNNAYIGDTSKYHHPFQMDQYIQQTLSVESRRSVFDDDDTLTFHRYILDNKHLFNSTQNTSSMDRRRGSVLDTNAIFSPLADWDFDHDMGMTAGPDDDSMPLPAATIHHSDVTNNPFIKRVQAQPGYTQQHNWSSNSGASDSMPVPAAALERSNGTNNPFLRLEQTQPGYAEQHDWSLNSGASGAGTPTTFDNSALNRA
jgi:hypothetical protein